MYVLKVDSTKFSYDNNREKTFIITSRAIYRPTDQERYKVDAYSRDNNMFTKW